MRKKIDKLPILLTIEQIETLLNLDEDTIYKIIAINNFETVKFAEGVIRVPKIELFKWLTKKGIITN